MTLYQNDTKTSRGTVLVWGLLAALPFGGMIWQVLHHLVPLRRLGFDVWYVEDSGKLCLHPERWDFDHDYRDTVKFLRGVLALVGLEDRWVFRNPVTDECEGCLDARGLSELYSRSDAVLNLCASHWPREEHDSISCLALIQTDPVLPQLDISAGHEEIIAYHRRHDYLFTYASNINNEDCELPTGDFSWTPTRPPVVCEWWNAETTPARTGKLTTIGNWSNKARDAHWNGKLLRWQKDIEFERYLDIPRRSPFQLELALSGIDSADRARLESHGWVVRSAQELSDPMAYKEYIQRSDGEFTVAKEQNVTFQSGWFSDRSACYLAAGKPVITQDTGFKNDLPTGEGLFSFNTQSEVVEAMTAVSLDYEVHRSAARAIAVEYFDADKLIGGMMRRVGLL